ncbi:G0/G1 switch protein 2 [Pangasianodon hypophthalmus]|uniref:G0/G1 switch protein 2 n=1 Tax=Pangasianodon hypophthalmus TaxID=310915 RepID=UPI000EFE39A7|nr:G0/G1 switch protein 2 [Pangasianodon hypophthalmus]
MEMMQEIIPFAREMLSARPSKGAMKVYLVGGTFAVLGIMSGMVEAACSLFPDQEESTLTKLMEETITVTAQTQEPQTIIPEDDEQDAEMEAKAKELPMLRQRRMSFRAHAS